ncbi:CsbD family protein [Novosphingobium sp. PC22D]|uniref:CsbD family protein n=1 Tax=Novosphingobium sp. PC22D TaxID=1962403 RepID=UPI000BEF4EB5|nr:CsbD family protein [Novosphingobium sp. PC22D]PEQ10813.1 CsbD family protein [Novosphingobium sp. PC22D]
MGELKDKAKGIANEVAGNAKQAAGRAGDDPYLDAEGRKQERKGEAQQAAGKVKGALGDSI